MRNKKMREKLVKIYKKYKEKIFYQNLNLISNYFDELDRSYFTYNLDEYFDLNRSFIIYENFLD